MKALLLQILESRWFVVSVHLGLWVLLYLSLRSVGGKTPAFDEAESFSVPAQSPAPVARLEKLFTPGVWVKSFAETNSLNPFFTRHFIPPHVPAPAPPTTRKIELTYQGFYQTGTNVKQAIIKQGDAFLVTSIGAALATNLFVADATMQSVILTNLAAQTNVLTLNTQKVIEVPIQ